MAKEAKQWIAKAINPEHKGMLRKELNVKKGKKIPKEKLDKAAHSSNPKLAKRANLARTLSGLRK